MNFDSRSGWYLIVQTQLHFTLLPSVLAVADLLDIPKGCRKMSGGKFIFQGFCKQCTFLLFFGPLSTSFFLVLVPKCMLPWKQMILVDLCENKFRYCLCPLQLSENIIVIIYISGFWLLTKNHQHKIQFQAQISQKHKPSAWLRNWALKNEEFSSESLKRSHISGINIPHCPLWR